MNRVGIIQGRLSPAVEGRIQAFPVEMWSKEFEIAAECGFQLIEWVVDVENLELNPLFSSEGRKEINRLIKNTGVEVPSVCCDCFMKKPLTGQSPDSYLSRGILLELCWFCPEIGINMIELPLIGDGGLKPPGAAEEMIALFELLVPVLQANNLKFLIETDLDPQTLNIFLNQAGLEKYIEVNYDTGNSAYWGFNVDEEFAAYGSRIGNIHIKDCTPEEYSVTLGEGNVDFDKSFGLMKKFSYKGDFVLQTVRGNDDVGLAMQFKKFTETYIEKISS